MIREARTEDIPRLMDYCRSFYAVSGYPEYVNFDPERMEANLHHMIDSPDGVVLIGDGGYTGAVLFQMYFSSDIAAQELFWWVAPDKRGSGLSRALREGLEAWSRDVGAKVLCMSALDASDPEKVVRKYRKAGYSPAERSFIRSL